MVFETRVIIGVGGRKVTCDWYMFCCTHYFPASWVCPSCTGDHLKTWLDQFLNDWDSAQVVLNLLFPSSVVAVCCVVLKKRTFHVDSLGVSTLNCLNSWLSGIASF